MRRRDRARRDAHAPSWVNPQQIATPGPALDGLGNVIQNIPPIPGWNPDRQFGF